MSDPWDHIRRACADRRSGSVGVTIRASRGIAGLSTRADIRRAGRALLRAHPSMAPLWRLLAEAHEAADPADAAARFAERLGADTAAAADAVRWVLGRRNAVIVTHSSSSSVVAALGRVRARVAEVVCTVSLPGGEGRALARRLERDGFRTSIVPDAAVARACAGADLALVGADAVTEDGVVNKVGTYPLALAAADAGIGCYAIAATAKLVPAAVVADPPEGYESTPLELFDAVLTERGPRRPAALRRAVARVRIPRAMRPRR